MLLVPRRGPAQCAERPFAIGQQTQRIRYNKQRGSLMEDYRRADLQAEDRRRDKERDHSEADKQVLFDDG